MSFFIFLKLSSVLESVNSVFDVVFHLTSGDQDFLFLENLTDVSCKEIEVFITILQY